MDIYKLGGVMALQAGLLVNLTSVLISQTELILMWSNQNDSIYLKDLRTAETITWMLMIGPTTVLGLRMQNLEF
jgi:hypothetical protein